MYNVSAGLEAIHISIPHNVSLIMFQNILLQKVLGSNSGIHIVLTEKPVVLNQKCSGKHTVLSGPKMLEEWMENTLY